MCNQGLLKKLVAFLEYSERVPDDEDHWKIRLSVVWAVLNLSWREETTGSDLDNDDDDSAEDMDVDAGDGNAGSGAKEKNLAGLPNRGLKGRRLNISDVSYFETGLADQTI
ncbi:hypothetical protein KL920_004878 [Ogataea angusta]|nr:hypothetical protein KL920_004878 [Ogataea angusta]